MIPGSRLMVGLIGVAAATVLASAATQNAGDTIAISAVVSSRDGVPVRNLRASDFVVRENGKAVQVASVEEQTLGDAAARGRSIVLLMGGAATEPELSLRFQQIARGFVARAGQTDEIFVVRHGTSRDEVVGDRSETLMRIAEFRAPYGEPWNVKTAEDVLDRVAKISTDLAMKNDDGRRRAIVCVGGPAMFDVIEPPQRQYELEWPHWVKALNAAAKANVSVYVIDPQGLTGRVRINPDGLVAQTGGASLDNTNDFADAIDRVWRDTGNYYAVRYVSGTPKRDLQNIEVKVNRPDVKVVARRSR